MESQGTWFEQEAPVNVPRIYHVPSNWYKFTMNSDILHSVYIAFSASRGLYGAQIKLIRNHHLFIVYDHVIYVCSMFDFNLFVE